MQSPRWLVNHQRSVRIVASLGFLILNVRCASDRVLTREEWLSAGQHTYKNVKKEDLIASAEKVLRLADGDDFQMGYSPNGFMASRNWLIYAVIAAVRGTDYWNFEVTEKGADLIANVRVSTTSGGMGITGSSAAGIITTPNTGNPVQGTAIYDLFWARVDYVLGLSSTWPDCDDEKQKEKEGPAWGDLDHICDSVTLDNKLPNNLTEAEFKRIFRNVGPYDRGYLAERRNFYLSNRKCKSSGAVKAITDKIDECVYSPQK